MHNAAVHGHLDCIRTLIAVGADTLARNKARCSRIPSNKKKKNKTRRRRTHFAAALSCAAVSLPDVLAQSPPLRWFFSRIVVGIHSTQAAPLRPLQPTPQKGLTPAEVAKDSATAAAFEGPLPKTKVSRQPPDSSHHRHRLHRRHRCRRQLPKGSGTAAGVGSLCLAERLRYAVTECALSCMLLCYRFDVSLP